MGARSRRAASVPRGTTPSRGGRDARAVEAIDDHGVILGRRLCARLRRRARSALGTLGRRRRALQVRPHQPWASEYLRRRQVVAVLHRRAEAHRIAERRRPHGRAVAALVQTRLENGRGGPQGSLSAPRRDRRRAPESGMSAEPKDPLAFDFGVNFKSASDRVREERTTRMEHAARAMPYHIAFLDDYLRCIMPHDLILLAAATGVGKTELARMIATQAAANGKHVHYFALEAEPLEIERRTKFTVLASIVASRQIQIPGGFTYADWYAGKLESYVASIDVEADAWVQHKYKTLHTYYRGSKFDHDDIRRLFLAIQSESDLIILDHLHYVDIDDDNENRGFKRTMKMIRDVALGMGRPVIIVAHLRKRDQARRRELVPVVED